MIIHRENLWELAQKIGTQFNKGDVICLYGDLGAGKTTFCQFLIHFLTETSLQEISSPTFNLVHVYENECPVWHFDFYRLKYPEEAFEIGFEEALATGISLIEWPEKMGPLIPPKRLDIRIQMVENDDQSREFHFENHGTDFNLNSLSV